MLSGDYRDLEAVELRFDPFCEDFGILNAVYGSDQINAYGRKAELDDVSFRFPREIRLRTL
jgi:hypothetical protein